MSSRLRVRLLLCIFVSLNDIDFMTELYRLDTDELPCMPTPHDCVIKTILVDKDKQCISFVFENDISEYDSVANQRPNAKSLVIKYHFYYDVEDYKLLKWVKPSLLHRYGGWKYLCDEYIKNGKHDALLKLTKYDLEYLCHHVAYKFIIIELWADTHIVLQLDVDTVEYEWKY